MTNCPACNNQNLQYLDPTHSYVCLYCKYEWKAQRKVVMNSFVPPITFGPNGDNYEQNPHNPYNKDKEVLEQGGTQFSTGAVRSADKAGVMYHLITPIGLRRIAETYKEGFDKYGTYNWERGMPIGDILNHAIAHIYAYLEGTPTNEDDLAHAAWNLLAAMHMEETHPNLDHQLRPNHPLYQKRDISEPSTSAIQIASRVWCDAEMGNIIMDKDAAIGIATIIDKLLKESNEKQSVNSPNNQATT